MGEGSDRDADQTASFQPVPDITEPDPRRSPPWDMGPSRVVEFPGSPSVKYVGPVQPRLSGWSLAFTIVGVTFCVSVLLIISLAIVFADKLPAATP